MQSYSRRQWKDAAIGYAILAAILAPIAACTYFVYGGDSEPAPPPPTPMVIVTPSPWTPAPRYTGPGSLCRDGTLSNSRGRGTCSHHGGVE